MKKLLVLTLLVMASVSLMGQKADFKSAEKFRSANMSAKVGDLSVRANWINETNKFWYSYKTTAGKNYFIVNSEIKSKQPLFDSRYMASEIHKLVHKPFNELDLPITNLEFEKKSSSKFTFQIDSIQFLYNMANRSLVIKDTIEKKKNNTNWASYSSDSTWIAFAKNHNLFLMKAGDKDSVEIQLTTDGELNYGYEGYRSDTTKDKRVRSGARWFKDETKLYIVKSDSRKVKDLFVINTLSNPRPTLETYKYAMPGEEHVPQSELIIFDVESKGRTDVDVKKWKDQKLTVNWTSQESSDKMVITRRKRDLKELDVCMVNVNTGELKILFQEEMLPYIYQNFGYAQLSVLNEGDDIIWWSQRNGWGQLYLYDGTGKLKSQVTDGYFVTGRIQRIDTLGRVLYVQGFGREKNIHPYYNMIYKVSLDKKGMTLLTKEDATHSFSMSKTNKYFVDTYSRVDMVPQSVLRDNQGNIVLKLEEPDLTELYATGWKMPERFVVKAKDGVTNLYGVMYKPFKMEADRKYPVISYVYPGPQTESVPYGFTTTGGKNIALSQLGFVVVNFGHRGGSPQRNNYYHTYGYDNLRDYALVDDKYGIEQLADRHEFINIDKVGIYGHSGGGFMSTAAILSYPDFYDVAVSSAGNHDNNIYNQYWSESHNGIEEIKKILKSKDTTDVKQDSVKITFKSKVPKNQDLAGNLKGHLLLVHGDVDNNVHPGNTIRVANELIKANKRFDFMVMPGQRHGFGQFTAYFDRMMWYYFAEHLLDDYRTNVELLDF